MLTVNVSPESSGTIHIWRNDLEGNIEKEVTATEFPAEYTCFDWGDEVFLQALPAENYQWDHWEGTQTAATNPFSYLHRGENSFTVYFVYVPPPDPATIDDDGDGYTENQGDCNDADSSIYPGADEICGDGIDQDCNGEDLACEPPPDPCEGMYDECDSCCPDCPDCVCPDCPEPQPCPDCPEQKPCPDCPDCDDGFCFIGAL